MKLWFSHRRIMSIIFHESKRIFMKNISAQHNTNDIIFQSIYLCSLIVICYSIIYALCFYTLLRVANDEVAMRNLITTNLAFRELENELLSTPKVCQQRLQPI